MIVEEANAKLNHLPERSRVWIYQLKRPLTANEEAVIVDKASEFIAGWQAHGKQLMAGFGIFYKRFFVLAVDEEIAAASGCSIDSSVHFVQALGNNLNIDFFDRLHVVIKNGDDLISMHLNDFETALETGELSADTIVFNNLISNLRDFKSNWEVPISKSWHAKYLN